MAHKKAAWSAKNLRDSNPKFRWLKLAGGQSALAWNIIIRQTGDKYMCWNNTYKWKDFTIHAKVDGVVSFRKKRFTRFDGRRYVKTVVDVLPEGVDAPAGHTPNGWAKATVASKAQKKSVKKTTTKQTKSKASSAKAADKKPADKKASATKAASKKTASKASTKTSSGDDLTKIEGIGPVIQKLLNENGITTYEELSSTKVGDLRDILADNDLAMHEPMPWKKQATLAKNESWDELKEYQDELQAWRE